MTVKPVYQSASSECGLACVGMLINHYIGSNLDLQDLREKYDVALRGLSLRGLLRICSDYGIAARPLSVGLDKIGSLKLPCIIHWRFNHYVILEGVSKSTYRLIDPGVGRITVDKDQFDVDFTGVVVEVVKVDDNADTPEASKKLTLKDLVPISRPIVWIVSQVLALTIGMNIMALLSPLLLKFTFDTVIPDENINALWVLTASFAFLALLSGAVQYFRGAGLVELRRSLSQTISVDVFEKLVWLNNGYIERRSAGTVATNYRSVMSLIDALSEELLGTLVDGFVAIAVIILLCFLAPSIGMLLLSVMVIYAALFWINRTRKKAKLSALLGAEGRVGGFFVETVGRLQPIRLFQAETFRMVTFGNLQERLEDSRQRYSLHNNAIHVFGDAIIGVGWVVIIAFAASTVVSGNLSVGLFASLVVWVGLAVESGKTAISRLVEMDSLESHINRIADIIRGTTDKPSSNAIRSNLPKLEQIGMDNVSFRYGDDAAWLLKDCSFSLKRGEWKAISGRSGEGKSTLIKALTGLVEVKSGSIMVNETPLDHEHLFALRKQLGIVMQNDGLFGGSIRDNITFFDMSPDIEWLERCVEIAELTYDIERMPMKFESAVGEQGAGMSAGQLQRMLLARALYRRPQFLILDEFSANLDEDLETRILNNIQSLGLGVLTIAHRSAVLRAADSIIVLQDSALIDAPASSAEIINLPA